MPITGKPWTLRDTSITLKIGSDPATEYRCQLTAASLVPSAASGGNELETFCDKYTDSSGDATWTLELEGFQSYADAQDFSLWAFEHEGEKADFVLVPGQAGSIISATNPGFGGVVTVAPTTIGGTAKQYATFSVSLECESRPSVLKTPVVAVAKG